MQKVSRYFVFFIVVMSFVSFMEPNREKIKWISLETLEEQYAKSPRPILIDVYTNWCGWCKEMDRITYCNKKLVKYVNEHYYALRLDAESKDSLVFNNRRYGFNKLYKSNELAIRLLSGRMEFPTTVFLPAIEAEPAALSGYLTAKEMEPPLKYFAGGGHQSQSFIEFNKTFKGEW
jgi:thioredoxin-related protein